MRKLVLQMGVSLDGLVARSGRHGAGGWGLPPEDPALKQRKLAWLRDTGLHLMWRNTYEEMAEAWPVSDDAYAAPLTAPLRLELVDARTYSTGAALHVYRPAPAAS
jgi:dihydrofolate reductase